MIKFFKNARRLTVFIFLFLTLAFVLYLHHSSEVFAGDTDGNFSLPWKPGTTWRMTQGPANSQAVVDQILAETGLEAAIVDVNDLKRVAILAATPGASAYLLNQALLNNPAGNAAEQTPVVLIRPKVA